MIGTTGIYLFRCSLWENCHHDRRNDILTCIRSQFLKLPSWLGFFVTSRPEDEIKDITNIGKLAGAAMRMEDLELMPPFLKMLRGQTLDEDDLQHIAPGRDWNFQNIDVEASQLGDAIPVHWPGFPNIADDYPALCGFGKDVTEENVDEYLQWVKESMLKQYEEGIEAQVKYFLRGMQSVST